MLSVDHSSVQRKSSIKAKIRNISIHRHKEARFDEHSGDSERRKSLPGQEMVDSVDPSARSRARNVSHTALMDDSGVEHSRPDTTSTTASTVSQPQLALPIVTPSIVTTQEQNASDTTAPSIATVSAPVAILENVKIKDDVAEVPVVATGGFLSSVLNAASNFGTVLGAGSPRAAVTKSPRQGQEAFAESPGRSSMTQPDSLFSVRVPTEVSMKDMGLGDQVVIEPLGEGRSRASSRTTTGAATTVADVEPTQEVNPTRSGSVATTQSRRRRGSTTMSVFGGSDGQGQKITGFAVASNKRNREFHSTFRSVPDADYLLDDYGCALQKEILVHGRMYVSESHICFNSNIFGWVTNLVIAFTDITSLEKKSTAGIFPNAIQVSTQQAKHVFASFISRDTTFDLIVNIWRLTHPSIQSTAHGVEVAGVEGDDLYDSDSETSDDDDEGDSSGQSVLESDDEVIAVVTPGTTTSPKDSPALLQVDQENVIDAALADASDYPGPREHAPTEAPSLTDGTAFSKALMDECFNAPIGKVYDLLYGTDTSFMQDFLTTNQKLLDVQVGQFSDKLGKSGRSISYVKPLTGPIGPKQTRCLLEDVEEMKDFNKCVQVVQSTTSPDVPSGDAFVIKTRFSLMWGPRNTTRLVTNCAIEWTKTSWIKGPIEKASNAGQVQFMLDLGEALKHHLSNGAQGKKKKAKSRRSRAGTEEHNMATSATTQDVPAPAQGILGTILGITSNININALTLILLLGMMVAMIRMQRTIRELTTQDKVTSKGSNLAGYNWQREETDLWSWLAQRTAGGDSATESLRRPVSDDSMTTAQIDEALAQVRIHAAVLERAQQLTHKSEP